MRPALMPRDGSCLFFLFHGPIFLWTSTLFGRICWCAFTTAPQRMSARIMKEGEGFVGKPGSEFTNEAQMLFTMEKCESMIGPGITTAVEQLPTLERNK